MRVDINKTFFCNNFRQISRLNIHVAFVLEVVRGNKCWTREKMRQYLETRGTELCDIGGGQSDTRYVVLQEHKRIRS